MLKASLAVALLMATVALPAQTPTPSDDAIHSGVSPVPGDPADLYLLRPDTYFCALAEGLEASGRYRALLGGLELPRFRGQFSAWVSSGFGDGSGVLRSG